MGKIGQSVTYYDSPTDTWFLNSTIEAKNDQTQKLTIRYSKGSKTAQLDYFTVPYRTYVTLFQWGHHKKVQENALKILACKGKGAAVPRDLWSETLDLIYSMCIQRRPFNYSVKLHQHSADYPKLVYGSLTPPSAGRMGLIEFAERLKNVPTPETVAREIDRLFNYINRYYVANHADEISPIYTTVMNAWALMNWSTIVSGVIEPCKQAVKTDPELVYSIASQMGRFLPGTAYVEKQ